MEHTFLIVIVLIAAGIAASYLFFSKKARVRRALKKAPLVKISDAGYHTGLVRFEGVLRFKESPMVSPLSGRACAYYEVVVKERRQRGKNSYWKTLLDEKESADFYIADESGEALVEMDNPLVALTMDTKFSSGTFSEASPDVEVFLNSRGLSSKGWLFNKNIRYAEGVLEEGERIAVAGICGRIDFLSSGENTARIQSGPEFRLVVTDDVGLANLGHLTR